MSEETETMEPGTTESSTAADAAIGQQQSPEEGYEPAELKDENRSAAAVRQDGDTNLDVILDIPVTLSMEIGRTRVSIQDLLQLAKGSVVELDRMAGEPLDVLVNGTLVARGEVVVVNDKFGVRLNDVISPADRVQSIR
jgi:flagellar motor switch protein FliN/FliY